MRESKNRVGETITSVIKCKIRGIRLTRSLNPNGYTPYTDEGFRWVKIEGAEYCLERDLIGDWLRLWCNLQSDITEDKIEFDKEDSEGGYEIGNGSYSVKMKLRANIPQFLSMNGKKIQIYYPGIVKKCTNCFGPHARKSCNHDRANWLEYVENLMVEHPNISEEFYGKWAPLIKEMKEKIEKNVKSPQKESQMEITTNKTTINPEPDSLISDVLSNCVRSTETKDSLNSHSNVCICN